MMTPSALPRIEKCVVSEALPQIQSTSIYAEGGLSMHDFLSAPSREEGLARLKDPRDREVFEALPIEDLPAFKPQHYAAEVAFAYDFATGQARETARMVSRGVAASFCKPGEMPGIADVVGLTDDAVEIWDFKRWFGRHLDRAEVNWQIRTYALMAARAYGRTLVRGGLIRAIEDGPWFDRFEMDAVDLDAHEAELRDLKARVDEVKRKAAAGEPLPPPVEGPHCTYCPAFWACPAKRSLLQAVVSPEAETALVPNGLEWTPERAALAYQRIQAAKTVLARVEGMLHDYVGQHPVPLPNGKMLGKVERTRESFVSARAQPVLKELFGDIAGAIFAEAEKVDRSMPKDRLNKALKKYVLPKREKKTFAPLEREVQEAMRKAGAISVATFSVVDEFKPTADEQLDAAVEAHEAKALTASGAPEGFQPVPELEEVAHG